MDFVMLGIRLRLSVLFVVVTSNFALAAGPNPKQLEFFERKIRPVLAQHCYKCHSADAEKLEASLRLDSKAGTLAGGDSGPALVPGNSKASLLVKALRYKSKDLSMPPD